LELYSLSLAIKKGWKMPRISLSDIVGRHATSGNRLPDTLKLKLGLERLGYYEPGQRGFTPGADDGLWCGLESYQRDRGLDIDGVALPDGPTVSAINDELEQAPATPLILGTFDVPLSAEAVASNQRTVRALQSFRGVGDLPTFAVAALRSGNPGAPAEIADLLARSNDEAPEQGRRLRAALAEYMDGDDLARLDAAARQRVTSQVHGETAMEHKPAETHNDDHFDGLMKKLYPREGGFMIDARRGDTFKGVTAATLKAYNKQNPAQGFPDDVTKLTEPQRRAFYRDEFYERPKIDKLAELPGLREAAPQLIEQMFDAGVLHGSKAAGQWLQKSLDEALGTDLSISKNGARSYDGIVGPDTRAAVEQAMRDGKIDEVNNAIVEKRLEAMRADPKHVEYQGWFPRAMSFRR
jgi:lysozyme family protein